MLVEDLELSVRTGNVLRNAGIVTLDQLKALDASAVLALKNAGRKTWREIQELQQFFDEDSEDLKQSRWRTFTETVAMLNQQMNRNPEFRVVDADRGFLTAVRSSPIDGQRRMT